MAHWQLSSEACVGGPGSCRSGPVQPRAASGRARCVPCAQPVRGCGAAGAGARRLAWEAEDRDPEGAGTQGAKGAGT